MFSPTKSLFPFLSVLRSYDMLLVRVNFSVSAITPWPKVTYGRSLLWLAFQRDKSLSWQPAAGMAAGAGSWELLSSAVSRKSEVGLAHIVSLRAHAQWCISSISIVPPSQTVLPAGNQVFKYPRLWRTFLIQNTTCCKEAACWFPAVQQLRPEIIT